MVVYDVIVKIDLYEYDVTDMNLFSKIKALKEFCQTSDLSRSFFRREYLRMPIFPKNIEPFSRNSINVQLLLVYKNSIFIFVSVLPMWIGRPSHNIREN